MRIFGMEVGQPPVAETEPGSPEQLERAKSPVPLPQEQILSERPVKEEPKALLGISGAKFVTLKDDGSGVFKPYIHADITGEYSRGRCIAHERAAYVIDRFLGFNFVPPTVIRRIGLVKGSLQEFIPDARNVFEVGRSTVPQEELAKLNLFDFMILTPDRHDGNFLLKDGKVIAIDHGLSLTLFKARSPHSFSFSDFYVGAISQDLRENLARFASWHEGQELLQDMLSELLGSETATAYLKRIRAVLGAIDGDGYLSEEKFRQNYFDKQSH